MRLKLLLLLTTISIFSIKTSIETSARTVIPLDFGWRFQHQDSDSSVIVNLPHDYLIGQPWIKPSSEEIPDNRDGAANIKSRLSARAFKEPTKGVYSLRFTPQNSWKGKRILLDFEGIMLVGDVFLNGEYIGGTDYGYLGFEIDISKKICHSQENEIIVKTDTGKPSNSRWYTGGGLYRQVKIIVTDPTLYFSRHGLCVQTNVTDTCKAKINISIETESRSRDHRFIAETDILSPDGNTLISRIDTIPVNLKWRHREYALHPFRIENPQLWSCETPALYTAHVKLRRPDNSAITDSMSVKFGIRDIKFSPEFGFKLNGKKVLLKGIANHHTLGALGAAAYPKAIEKRLRLIKDFGFNHVRTSHNPYSTDFLNICDSLGILVVDELYDKWLKQYSGGRKDWTAQWQHDLPEWIKRDRNHPSVIMWSLGNELQGYSNLPFNDWGVTAYRLQKTLLERYDTTRQATVAMHPRYRSLETDSLPAPLARETDIASYNYRYMYFPGDSRRFPDMIFYQSEANRSGMGPNFYEPDNNRVIGLAYWGMIDYLGESAGWPAKGWEQGVFDMSLQPKPEAWFIKSMFSDEPVVHIGIQQKSNESYLWNDVEMKRSVMVDHWNFRKGDVHDITVFSNADEVELRLNGKSLKRRINNLSNTKLRNRFEWKNVAYSPGILEAIAYNSGKEVAIHRIETAGKAVKLVAEPENAPWRNDGYDLCHVVIRAVDAKGRTVPGISSEIEISLSGDASIVAVDNGDMHSNELHIPYSEKSARRSLYRGKALVILRAGKSNTPIELKAKTANLHPAKINMQYIKR